MVSRVIPVEVFDLVIFGATGDLARRKILPGLFRRFVAGQMPEDSRIIGAARADLSDDDFRTQVAGALEEFVAADRRDPALVGPSCGACTMCRSTPRAKAAGRGSRKPSAPAW